MKKKLLLTEDVKERRKIQHRIQSREWYRKRREKITAKRRERRATDEEYAKRERANGRASYFRHRAERRAKMKLYEQSHPEIIKKIDQHRDPETRRKYSRDRLRRMRAFIVHLRSVPCSDCGGSYPHYVMEFDHARGEKKCYISQLGSTKRLLEELKKCDVVCANCHKTRTWNRNQHRRKYEVAPLGTSLSPAPNPA